MFTYSYQINESTGKQKRKTGMRMIRIDYSENKDPIENKNYKHVKTYKNYPTKFMNYLLM